LAATCGVADPGVAVRSSAVDEDGAAHSFAGQHETYLNVVGARAVAEAVVRCWTSVRTARALAYRRRQGLAVARTRLAVLVQQLIPADASAVVVGTTVLKDGMLLTVDGSRGIVRIDSRV
jgi:pyruvate,water dikinase